MAIYLIEVAVVVALSLIFDAITLETDGLIWSLIGMTLALFEAGRIAAVGNISASIILSIAFDGSAFQNNTVDGTAFLVGLSLLVVVSAMLTITAASKRKRGV